MATSLTATFNYTATGTFTKVADLETASMPIAFPFSLTLANGVGANQADVYFTDERAVENGTPDDIDLAGELTDIYGSTVTFAKVKGIAVYNTSSTAAQILTVGGTVANAWAGMFGDASDELDVGPGGFFCNLNPSAAGFAVTAGTGDILRITSASGTITYRIQIIGTSE